jgi:hypothetical protein
MCGWFSGKGAGRPVRDGGCGDREGPPHPPGGPGVAVSGHAAPGACGHLRVINDARRDSVARLHQFRGDHPGVRFASPTAGPYSQYTAQVPPQTILGEKREIIVKSPDLCGPMDQLDDLFTAPANPD